MCIRDRNSAKELQADPALLRQVLPSMLGGAGAGANVWPPNVQAINQQIFSFERDRADLLVELSAEHPRVKTCLLYTSPSPRDRTRSRMPSSA